MPSIKTFVMFAAKVAAAMLLINVVLAWVPASVSGFFWNPLPPKS